MYFRYVAGSIFESSLGNLAWKGTFEMDETVSINVLIETLIAAHLTKWVVSPFRERGGIFLVSPPQQLKSTIIKKLKIFPDALVVSDLNYQQISTYKDDICSGRYSTIGFVEFNKVYQRNPATSANLEGTLASIVCEGWSGPPHEDQRAARDEARSLVIGGMTKATYSSHLKQWMESGFAHRFIWCHYKLANESIIGDAIESQEPIDLSGQVWTQPNGEIKWNLTPQESNLIRNMIQNQPGGAKLPYALLLKIAVVLKWRYSKSGGKTNHMYVLNEFSKLMQNQYVMVGIPKKKNE